MNIKFVVCTQEVNNDHWRERGGLGELRINNSVFCILMKFFVIFQFFKPLTSFNGLYFIFVINSYLHKSQFVCFFVVSHFSKHER